MSLFDAITIPIIFFLLFIVVGVVYYEMATFKTAFQPYNASFNNSTRAIYDKFIEVHEYEQSTLNFTIIGIILVIIYIALVMAAIVYAHPGYFVILLFLGGGVVYAWYAMDNGITNVLSIPGIGSYFDPVSMDMFYVIRNNMYLLISIIIGAMVFALYFKAGNNSGQV